MSLKKLKLCDEFISIHFDDPSHLNGVDRFVSTRRNEAHEVS